MNIVQRLLNARELVDDLESDFIGMQVNYKDNDYCVVEAIDGEFISLYIEDEDGNVTHAGITLEALEDCLI